jgi:palmitoyltransferase
MLKKHSEELKKLDRKSWSPLHLAVMSGNSRLVKKLLIYGADRNLKGMSGQTPSDVA